MLYPQNNRCRTVIDLCGFWELKVDPEATGVEQGWSQGFEPDTVVGVPGSWNEQLAEMGLMNYIGTVWYSKDFFIPDHFINQRIFIRFGSVDFGCQVWLNGEIVGGHDSGFLPFEFEITEKVNFDKKNRLILQVQNLLSYDSIPQGVSPADYASFNKEREETYPPTVFDFFMYGGIHRPVKLYVLPQQYLDCLKVESKIVGEKGQLLWQADFQNPSEFSQVKITLWDGDQNLASETLKLDSATIAGQFSIEDCQFWRPEKPHLYQLQFELFGQKNQLIDEYLLETGVREVKVTDSELLLNGQPIFLRGFGKHEDFSVLGKGFSSPLIVKDFHLMQWIGANSFRTSHYPYAEEVMQMADRLGFLVIDEVPAVSLNFKFVNEKTLANHRKSLQQLLDRDRNHPCVISWSIANEPGIWGEPEAMSAKAKAYWQTLYDFVKQEDPSRPVTIPTCSMWGDRDLGYQFCDFISVNRYWGWYEIPGDIEKAAIKLKEELENLHKKYRKPIFVSELGADTIEGEHATYPQMFTEEYQVQLIQKYFEVIESLNFTVGEHIWNFADFRTAQHFRRVVLNKKGVFNRERQPKSAAFSVRNHWRKLKT
ncbi:MAG: beta-glucuronidase [bacterium]